MGELAEFFKEKYINKSNIEARDIMQKQKVKNKILELCDKHLSSSKDIFIFEILPNDLPYAVSVIVEEPLVSKYVINQVSNSIFVVRLRVMNIK